MSERFYIHYADDTNRQLIDAESDFNIHIEEIGSDEELIKLCNLLNEQQSIIRRDEISIKTMMCNMKKLEEEKVELMEDCACQYKQIQKLESENEDLREVNKENQRLHEENVKQCEKWRKLYEIKDAEVTARVDTLNRVCNYYLTETRFKGDTNPNEAVKEVINEILNAPIYKE